jgi:hypothetical protein
VQNQPRSNLAFLVRVAHDDFQRLVWQRALQRLASSQGARWDEIYALCRLNNLPFNATGEVMKL